MVTLDILSWGSSTNGGCRFCWNFMFKYSFFEKQCLCVSSIEPYTENAMVRVTCHCTANTTGHMHTGHPWWRAVAANLHCLAWQKHGVYLEVYGSKISFLGFPSFHNDDFTRVLPVLNSYIWPWLILRWRVKVPRRWSGIFPSWKRVVSEFVLPVQWAGGMIRWLIRWRKWVSANKYHC